MLIIKYKWQLETVAIFKQFTHQFKDTQHALLDHIKGEVNGEPFYLMADMLIRWAKAHRKHNKSDLCNDYYSLKNFKGIAWSILQMGSAQGVIALELGMTRDSKDNSVLNNLIAEACRLAGVDFNSLSL